jgi:hypothetical protein
MKRRGTLLPAVCLAAGAVAAISGQTRAPARPAATGLQQIAADIVCPSDLGIGVKTKARFCDILTGRDLSEGVLVRLPPRRGPATLTFQLHNRHTFSEDLIRANRAFTRYTATVGVLTPDNTLLIRGVVESEFRAETDLLDRIEGGAGPGGVKAVAPLGQERVVVTVPADVESVTILGEKLMMERLDGASTYSAPGRPVAVVSQVQIEFRPGPARRR